MAHVVITQKKKKKKSCDPPALLSNFLRLGKNTTLVIICGIQSLRSNTLR